MRAMKYLALVVLWAGLSSCSPGPEFRSGDMLSVPISKATLTDRVVTWHPDPAARTTKVVSRQRLKIPVDHKGPLTISVYLTNLRHTPDSSLTMSLDGVPKGAETHAGAPVPEWWPKRIQTHIRKWPEATSRLRYDSTYFPKHTTRYDLTFTPTGPTHELTVEATFRPHEMTASLNSWGMLLGEYAPPSTPSARYELRAPERWEALTPTLAATATLAATVTPNARGLYAMGARPHWPQAKIDAIQKDMWLALGVLTLLYLVVFFAWVTKGTKTERRRLILTMVYVPVVAVGLTWWEDHTLAPLAYEGWSYIQAGPYVVRNMFAAIGVSMGSWFVRLLPLLWKEHRENQARKTQNKETR